ncbi:MAG TPA: phosphatidylglycerophosphatase A [Rhizomicrobium sp.]|nr:phosphatidylglycerophosphatase A [Rhizomicrobium sp.]
MSDAATLFGLGRIPFAPGTIGSLVALPIAWLSMLAGGMYATLALAAIVAVFGIWASDAYAVESGEDDPSECIIDEVAGQLLACALSPLSLGGFALAFAMFRLFDISKLWPISAAERLQGGIGIMADDLVAGLIAGIVVAVAATTGVV